MNLGRAASIGVLATVMSVPACQSRVATAPRAPAPAFATDDGMLDLAGGASLHVHCVGEGSPLVMLEVCLGCDATSWRDMQAGIGRFTRACMVDRAGSGYSSPAPKPHLARQLAGELREALGRLDASGGVVLVGHGLGGLFAQMVARDSPRDVAGMVLVDTQTQDYDSRYYAKFPPAALTTMKEDLASKPENLD